MIIIGVTHPISHNTAACLLIDGKLVAFAEEERFTRLKHAPRIYPHRAIEFCLRYAGLTPQDVNATAVGFEQPRPGDLTTEMIAQYIVGTLPASALHPHSVHLSTDTEIQAYGALYHYDHHRCHAASAFTPSGFDEANVISLDGWGGRLAGLLGYQRRGHPLEVIAEINPANSWGELYGLVTQQLGFRFHSGEGKTMGLASYGAPDDGLLPDWCDQAFGLPDAARYRRYLLEDVMRRNPGEPLTERHKNLAATLQHYYERSLLRMAQHLSARTSSRNFVLAGGVALNCTGNGKLAAQDFVDRIFIQPASHDAGTALGAAILAHEQLTGGPCTLDFDHAYWGPDYSDDDIRSLLRDAQANHREVDPVEAASTALLDNKVIGWFQGRAEAGPRALGARSILANPTDYKNLDRVNRIKRREPWRPLAPSVLEERFFDVFDMRVLSPFMLIAGGVKKDWRARLPAVVHVDGSARPQAVSRKTNPLFHQLLVRLDIRAGIPAILNTSFNLDDEPLVNSPEHALASFFRSGLDTLVIGNFVVEKALHT
ncbi:MAG: carbamoyltransferase [Alphaproteobacteria bacterium]|jgi:carbamoyltransferase|nr:carbamoyltransferase [Alphaproteobacteria bacterium]